MPDSAVPPRARQGKPVLDGSSTKQSYRRSIPGKQERTFLVIGSSIKLLSSQFKQKQDYTTTLVNKTLCSELELFGMKKSGLPKFVNGDWGYENVCSVAGASYSCRVEDSG